ncbi:hypothetical protein CDEST_13344 [Colletotrichum destructivum]|uniref:C2H2-type domain-containing protein n=1 Tax=Colletotrichum destructivum TaxID=34406 RepID=A0AAX4IYK1_9PEZI|nr:hypothetical protein CDEST_13344 [Colletotrichum destructivum]
MSHQAVANSRVARVWSAGEHESAVPQKTPVDASARTDEASRDLAYQFLRTNRTARRVVLVDDDYSVIPTRCAPSRDRVTFSFECTRPEGRRHSSFEPGTTSGLAYRVKEQASNPRKHQRGSPPLDDVEEQMDSTEERHCKRVSGDSGYGSDSRRRRREQRRAASDAQRVNIEMLSNKSKVVVTSCPASDSDSDETLGIPRRPRRRLRRHSLAAATETTSDATSVAPNEHQQSVVETTGLTRSPSHSPKGLRRVKGTTTLRPEVDPQLRPLRPGIKTTTEPNTSVSNSPQARIPSLLLKTSTWSPTSQGTARPMVQRQPRPVSGPPALPVNGHSTAVPKLVFSSVEEQYEVFNESGDESSVESGMFSVPNSPIEPFQLDDDDPFVPHLDAVVTFAFDRFRDWQVRQRGQSGMQEGRSQARRVSFNTNDSGRSSRKRSHSGLPDDPASDDDIQLVPGHKRPKVPAPPARTLACPFWKKDPDNHRQCYKKVLSRIKYVKTHLYRFHAAPITCPCCGAEFQSEDVRDEHLRARRCEVVEPVYIANRGGLAPGRMRQVSKRADPRHTEEEQWFVIWDTIFPNTPRPSSAYIDGVLSEDVCSFHEFLASSGNDIVVSYFSAHDPDFARGDRASLYERFVRDGVLERIYEEWAARRGLRQPPHDAIDLTPPQSDPTESENPSRASSAHGNSFTQGPPPQTRPAEDIQPVPATDLQFAGQGFGEFDFGIGLRYDSREQDLLLDDLESMFSGADQQHGWGGPSATSSMR